ncbi:proton extrusion protein PcxA [Oscillatoriales cyanobacterium LEGE 11467]|uniref:Proton extrusion protein PxcA n=1 Tax=Zarconia navalis LEGE 11467 TaxID=1828826 RepID=A0A928VU93_9CYAN|nr:proton extrusion protein PcxA [Zarconia navalis]MBE9040362.1 proton extrusion protein PcxA [Zarconia navalis LEGE 11467]
MKASIFSPVQKAVGWVKQRYAQTPDRALEAAYRSAIAIEAIENEYFSGEKIQFQRTNLSSLELEAIQKELKTNLGIIRQRIAEFNSSRSILSLIIQTTTEPAPLQSVDRANHQYLPEEKERFTQNLKKLKIIDSVVAKYRQSPPQPPSSISRSQTQRALTTPKPNENRSSDPSLPELFQDRIDRPSDVKPVSKRPSVSVLPRSILRTIDRLKRELDPQAENEVVEEFRYHKNKTVLALKFILLLILIPLLTHQLSKNFVISPIYEHFFAEKSAVFLNHDFEEEAFMDLNRFEERLKFEILIGQTPKLSEEEMEEQVEEKASEIAMEYHIRSDNAIENVFSDLMSLGAFCLVIFFSKREIAVLKSFIDDVVYGLSDSAKAFIIILFTDIFVGYHSPHGWEIILEGLAHHFGIPESRDFNFLFIATFPVILDTVMKYWIFRYLNRISPSAVATYRNMNE